VQISSFVAASSTAAKAIVWTEQVNGKYVIQASVQIASAYLLRVATFPFPIACSYNRVENLSV